MSKISVFVLILSAFAFNANAFNCENIKKRQKRVCERRGETSRKCKKLTAKAAICDQGGGRAEWKAAKKDFRADWKANKDSYKGKARCHRILKKMGRACGRKPNGRRCKRLSEKAQNKGCN